MSIPLFCGTINVPATFLGMHFHRWPAGNPLSPAPTFNFGMVRTHDYGVAWNNIESIEGSPDWAKLDGFVNTHFAAGRKILFTMYGTPTWAATTNGKTHLDRYNYLGGADVPADIADLANFITALVDRYNSGSPKKLWGIEIWNEPNFRQDWSGFFWGSASDLVSMGYAIKTAAKAVDSDIVIMGPGFDDSAILREFYAADDGSGHLGKDLIDAWGFHFYRKGPMGQTNCQDLEQYLGYAQSAAFAAGVSTSVPTYITEMGFFPNDCFFEQSESTRALLLKRVAVIAAYRGVQGLIFYAYDDNATMGLPPNISDSAVLQSALNDIHTNLAGATITRVTQLDDGSYQVRTSNGSFTW